ncbi:MAG: phosphatidylglycerophosphatase A [Candidatus Omnitrophica bacterium]|nr:phosphatidylglycerophosphatase A [Candidatus Omnitrophota bacterium]
MSDKFIRISSTFFYVGNSPVAPGTLASFVGALICIILWGSPWTYLLVTLGVTALGLFVSGPMEDLLKNKDPSCVVIDEVSGIMLALFMLPLQWPVLITAFFLFRALDMFKLYPVNEMEKFEGGLGIMMDDIVAGVYTNIVMHIAVRWAGII